MKLFHALSTYFNIIRWYVKAAILGNIMLKYIPLSSGGKFGEDTKMRCMACIACAIRDLEKHQTHLAHLDESIPFLWQRMATAKCLEMFYDRLCDFGVDSFNLNVCGCIGQGSNRTSSWLDDIVIVRAGEPAMDHLAQLGESLLGEVSGRRGFEEEISKRYKDLIEGFQTTLEDLQRDEILISREILTRGYRLEFEALALE